MDLDFLKSFVTRKSQNMLKTCIKDIKMISMYFKNDFQTTFKKLIFDGKKFFDRNFYLPRDLNFDHFEQKVE